MINLLTTSVKSENKEDVLAALDSLAEYDADFIGENGDEFLWDETVIGGFNTNRDYVHAKAAQKNNPTEIVKTYLDNWVVFDTYYNSVEYECIYSAENTLVAIAVAFCI